MSSYVYNSQTFGPATFQPWVFGMHVHAMVRVKGAEPNAEYDVRINYSPSGCGSLPTHSLVTNGKGHGNVNAERDGIPMGVQLFWVEAIPVAAGNTLSSPAVMVTRNTVNHP